MYGHIRKLAEAEKQGIEAAGGSATLLQVAETLPEEVLAKMGAAGAKDTSIPVLSDPKQLRKVLIPRILALTKRVIVEFDAILFGIPTRYGPPC